MNVIDIKYNYSGSEAGGTDRTRTISRVYTVLVDDASAEPEDLTFPLSDGTITLPGAGAPHPTKTAYLSKVPKVRRKLPGFFEISVEYETPDPQESASSKAAREYEDPLEVPADYAWSVVKRQVPYDVDLAGVPAVNPNLEPYEGLTREVSDPVLTITRNEATFYPDDLLYYNDTVCTYEFFGAAAGRARLELSAEYSGGSAGYWRKRYVITFRMSTPESTPDEYAWYRAIFQVGHKYLDDTGRWRTSETPVPLDEDGFRVAADEADVLYLKEYYVQNWDVLALEPA